MDTLSACLAFGPLALYLLWLATIHLSRRPELNTGTREILSLGLAIAGLVLVGPMRLFMPEEAATWFGPLIWIILCGLYFLVLTLVALATPPRLIVHNIRPEQMQSLLSSIAAELDPDHRWAGEALSMPKLGVHLRLDAFPPMQNATLTASGAEQSLNGWNQLARSLRARLRDTPAVASSHGVWLAVAGALMLTALAACVAHDPQTIAQGLERMLNP